MKTGQDIFQYRKTMKENISLEYPGYPSLAPFMLRQLCNIFALEDYLTSCRKKGTADRIKHGGLPGSIGSDEPEYLSLVNDQFQSINCRQTAEVFSDIFQFQ